MILNLAPRQCLFVGRDQRRTKAQIAKRIPTSQCFTIFLDENNAVQHPVIAILYRCSVCWSFRTGKRNLIFHVGTGYLTSGSYKNCDMFCQHLYFKSAFTEHFKKLTTIARSVGCWTEGDPTTGPSNVQMFDVGTFL